MDNPFFPEGFLEPRKAQIVDSCYCVLKCEGKPKIGLFTRESKLLCFQMALDEKGCTYWIESAKQSGLFTKKITLYLQDRSGVQSAQTYPLTSIRGGDDEMTCRFIGVLMAKHGIPQPPPPRHYFDPVSEILAWVDSFR